MGGDHQHTSLNAGAASTVGKCDRRLRSIQGTLTMRTSDPALAPPRPGLFCRAACCRRTPQGVLPQKQKQGRTLKGPAAALQHACALQRVRRLPALVPLVETQSLLLEPLELLQGPAQAMAALAEGEAAPWRSEEEPVLQRAAVAASALSEPL